MKAHEENRYADELANASEEGGRLLTPPGERNLAPFANLMLQTHGGDAPPAYRDNPGYQTWPVEGWHDNWWLQGGQPQGADPMVKTFKEQLPERGEELGDLGDIDFDKLGSVNPVQGLLDRRFDGFISSAKVKEAVRSVNVRLFQRVADNDADVTVSPLGYHAAVISSLGKIDHFAPGLTINGAPYDQAMEGIPFAGAQGEVHIIGHPHPVVAKAAQHIVSTGSPQAYDALQKAAPGTFLS